MARIIGRLPHLHAAIRLAEAELCKIKRANKALNRPNRIVRSDIVLNACRKQARLVPALAGLECMIRHKPNRTSTPENAEFLPSLVGQICWIGSGKSHGLQILMATNGSHESAPDDRLRIKPGILDSITAVSGILDRPVKPGHEGAGCGASGS